jgi:hypothetical protein
MEPRLASLIGQICVPGKIQPCSSAILHNSLPNNSLSDDQHSHQYFETLLPKCSDPLPINYCHPLLITCTSSVSSVSFSISIELMYQQYLLIPIPFYRQLGHWQCSWNSRWSHILCASLSLGMYLCILLPK